MCTRQSGGLPNVKARHFHARFDLGDVLPCYCHKDTFLVSNHRLCAKHDGHISHILNWISWEFIQNIYDVSIAIELFQRKSRIWWYPTLFIPIAVSFT